MEAKERRGTIWKIALTISNNLTMIFDFTGGSEDHIVVKFYARYTFWVWICHTFHEWKPVTHFLLLHRWIVLKCVWLLFTNGLGTVFFLTFFVRLQKQCCEWMSGSMFFLAFWNSSFFAKEEDQKRLVRRSCEQTVLSGQGSTKTSVKKKRGLILKKGMCWMTYLPSSKPLSSCYIDDR